MITSWTNLNPRRRYLGCGIKKGRGDQQGCNYFERYDPIMCQRFTALIPGLLQSMNAKDDTIGRLRARERKLVHAIGVLVLLVLILVLV